MARNKHGSRKFSTGRDCQTIGYSNPSGRNEDGNLCQGHDEGREVLEAREVEDPPYPGLECSGTILALGTNVPSRWAVGDQVTPRIDDRVPSLLSTGGLLGAVVTRFPFAGLRPADRRRVRGEGGGASGAAAAGTGGSLAEGRCRWRIIPCKNSSIYVLHSRVQENPVVSRYASSDIRII
jgi:hypothetical protein